MAGDRALPPRATAVDATAIDLVAVETDDPLARYAVERYLAELADRFGEDVDPATATMTLGEGTFLLAVTDAEPVGDDAGPVGDGAAGSRVVGCGALRRIAAGVGEIKRMWVDPRCRGTGLGTRLLRALEAEAATRGWDRVRLDTNADLTEAIGLYERAGYRRIPRYNDNPHAQLWFEKRLG